MSRPRRCPSARGLAVAAAAAAVVAGAAACGHAASDPGPPAVGFCECLPEPLTCGASVLQSDDSSRSRRRSAVTMPSNGRVQSRWARAIERFVTSASV